MQAETCENGAYVEVVVQSADAAEPARLTKIEQGVELLLDAADLVPASVPVVR